MGWQDRLVYYRDFAYTARRTRMASGTVGDVPAAIYAEYVPHSSFLDAPDDSYDVASDVSSDGESPASEDAYALHEARVHLSQAAARCLPVRPALAHRLNSHRLHIRAKAKLQRDRLLSGRMIDVYVGEGRRHWALHRNLLCHHSERLEEELQGGDGKKRQERLDLPDYDPAGFELLVKWLYQGRLDDVSDLPDANQKYEYAVSCHKMYLLCDRFDMAQLKNVAMDQYRKGLNEAELVPDADEIDDIYRKSPPGSPFRRLMMRIAARQIMDPDSDRDVETYRQCFKNNPDFAIDLVKAIKEGTGGMLFDDPTDPGNECEYHDHEAGPNCHVKGKGKGKGKQARKTTPLRPDLRSASSDPSTRSVPTLLPPRRPRPPPILQPPPRHARRQSEATSAGPLRRRLTSPASSTVETTTENATAGPPSPNTERDKYRRVTPPERRPPSPPLTEETPSLPAPDDRPLSSDGASRPLQASSATSESGREEYNTAAVEQRSPPRGLWQWATAGTRLGMLAKIPHQHVPLMTSKAANTAVNGALEGGKSGPKDDFSIPSAISTDPHNEAQVQEVAAAEMEGLGLANSTVEQRSLFTQTKRSSDDLVASLTGTPSPQAKEWTNGEDKVDGMVNGEVPAPPATPSPAPRRPQLNGTMSESTPSPHRVAKYKIALAANILSPSRVVSN
ncbi:hypothetical protein BU23DRAFT_560777 [Bimuria novae-zelandiae CBS 107.79]|uniref:BTB domain-containing protein n=1 Tax=Bimuria novae-zelandiae CBS 107.79 TaxID=1447943 RepID=A0A6A5UKQ7_9PLEO|nr:hypothetical protein BU23DRAFT_560777 [Bimuria novae-zelandiae CBS 107.79]